jgi:hypothetical protein
VINLARKLNMIGNSLIETEKHIDRELQAIGWPKLDLSNKQQTLGCIFSLLKQRSVGDLDYCNIPIKERYRL